MVAINVIFENPNKFYFEGETVRLKLEIHLGKASSLNNVIANFVGLSEISNGESKAANPEANKMHRNGGSNSSGNCKEIYFDDVLPLFLTEGEEAPVRSSGIRVFSLAYQLPNNLPTSIESSTGFVRYSVHVYGDAKQETFRKTEHFTVVARTDLNDDETARLPGVKWQPENQCIFQALFCKGTQIRGFLHIPKKGYIPGECMFINAEIHNYCKRPIEWVKASLIQVLKFHGSSKAVKEKRVVTELARGCVLPSDLQIWRSESILIPAIPPTTYSPKRLVSVKYKLLFQYKPCWLKKEIEIKQKIIIGTVRLVKFDLGQGEGQGIYSSELFNSSNLEPCIFGPHSLNAGDGADDDDNETCNTFSPLYPIYLESHE